MDEPWPRPCSRCGVPYDARLRGIDGRFHMTVNDVQEVDRHVLLSGHWREGVVPTSGAYTLVSQEGHRNLHGEVLPPPSAAAQERGQVVIRVLDGLPATQGTSGCLWGRE